MPTYTDKKTGKKSFAMNPQAGKAMHEGSGLKLKGEEKAEEKIHPGLHDEVAAEHPKLAKYDGHLHNGEQLAHHVELHHGGHPEGQPPAHEGHTHHTISHLHGGGGGGGGSEPHELHNAETEGHEQEIRNHEGYEEANAHMQNTMHEGCPECETEAGMNAGGPIGEFGGEDESEG
jgi:hypothetical protein